MFNLTCKNHSKNLLEFSKLDMALDDSKLEAEQANILKMEEENERLRYRIKILEKALEEEQQKNAN